MKRSMIAILCLLSGMTYGAPFPIPAAHPLVLQNAPVGVTLNTNSKQVLSMLSPHAVHRVASFDTIPQTPFAPIQTPGMSPGIVTPHAMALPYMGETLFVVGSDPLSRQWLKTHKTTLENLHAIGWLVQVQSQNQLHHMQTLAYPLPLLAMPGDVLADQLHHYPFVLNHDQVDQ